MNVLISRLLNFLTKKFRQLTNFVSHDYIKAYPLDNIFAISKCKQTKHQDKLNDFYDRKYK